MIELARLAVETGLWPLTEYVNGELVGVKKVRRPKPVEEYLKAQGRYKHLFKKAGGADMIKQIQALADANIAKFKLVD
jgi:pyruvate ferredoxin oxidoreductase beta subunit